MFNPNDFDGPMVDLEVFDGPMVDLEVMGFSETLSDDPLLADPFHAGIRLPAHPVHPDLADTSTVSETLDRLATCAPGPAAIGSVLAIDPSTLTSDDAVIFAVAMERQIAFLQSVQDDALLAASSPQVQRQEVTVHTEDASGRTRPRAIWIDDAIREELATALHWSLGQTHDRQTQARLLSFALPGVKQSLAAGRIAVAHANRIVQQATRLPGGLATLSGAASSAEREAFLAACAQLEGMVLPVAEACTPSRTRSAAEKAVIRIDEDGVARRRSSALRLRDAFVLSECDGLAVFAVRMATERAYACLAAVDALAHDESSTHEAPIGERRAEAAAALLLATTNYSDGSRPQSGLRVHLDITIDLPTLLGLQSAAGGGVADLAGAGPIPADVVRELLGDARTTCAVRRLVTDPLTGHLLDLGRTRYEIPDALRRLVVARDRVCRFPGCRRAARRCHLDHATAWSDGGETSAANLGALCTRHHQLKTHAGWDIEASEPDGSCTWRSPLGRTYLHEPEPPPPF